MSGPVSAMEAREIVVLPNEPSTSIIASQLPVHLNNPQLHQNAHNPNTDVTLPPPTMSNNPITPQNNPNNHPEPDATSEIQPDAEPGAPGSIHTPSENHEESPSINPNNPSTITARLNPEQDMMKEREAQNTPMPNETDDEDLVCEGLHCMDEEPESVAMTDDQAWQCSFYVTESDIEGWRHETCPDECGFLATAAKRQRAEVKLATLSPIEKLEFQKAKDHEIQNWLKTGTISKIMRDQVPPDQILRCRWILTWKPIDQQEREQLKGTKDFKAKARLVILGYLDPKIAEVPRDSPTLGRHSKMLLLQLIASKGWDLKSFDIKAAFLQGKNQKDRVLAIEPVAEIVKMMNLSPQEICKLEKGSLWPGRCAIYVVSSDTRRIAATRLRTVTGLTHVCSYWEIPERFNLMAFLASMWTMVCVREINDFKTL